MLREEETKGSCIVLFRADVVEIVLGEKGAEPAGLIVADLQGEAAAGCEMRGRGGDQLANQFIALRAAKKRDRRVVLYFRSQFRPFGGRNVGKVRDDQIVAAFDLFEQVAPRKANALSKSGA